jgi:hypothetical protein
MPRCSISSAGGIAVQEERADGIEQGRAGPVAPSRANVAQAP